MEIKLNKEVMEELESSKKLLKALKESRLLINHITSSTTFQIIKAITRL